MLRLHLGLVRSLQRESGDPMFYPKSLTISPDRHFCWVPKSDLHLDFEELKWSKFSEMSCTQNEAKTIAQLNVCTSLANSSTSSQATIPCEIETRTPDGVCEAVARARQLSWATRNDSRDVWVISSCETAEKNTPKIAQYFNFVPRGSLRKYDVIKPRR